MSRIDPRLTRRALLFAFFRSLFGARLPDRLRFVGARFTSIAGTEFEHLFRFCSFTGPRFAGAS